MANAEACVYSSGNRWERGAGLTGAADAKTLTVAGWFDTSTTASAQYLVSSQNGRVRAQLLANGRLQIDGRANGSGANPAGTVILRIASTSGLNDGALHHFVCSVNMEEVSQRWLYIDGVADLAVVTTYLDDTIDFTESNWGVGDAPSGAAALVGECAAIWLNNEYQDISSNIGKWYVSGNAPSYGADGSTPTGNQPLLFINSVAATLNASGTNLGSGGNGSVTGTLSDGTDPGDAGGVTGTAVQTSPSAQQAAEGFGVVHSGTIVQTAPSAQQSATSAKTSTGTVAQQTPLPLNVLSGSVSSEFHPWMRYNRRTVGWGVYLSTGNEGNGLNSTALNWLSNEAQNHPGIVVVQTDYLWTRIENTTTPGVYDWSKVDSDLTAVKNAGLKFMPMLRPQSFGSFARSIPTVGPPEYIWDTQDTSLYPRGTSGWGCIDVHVSGGVDVPGEYRFLKHIPAANERWGEFLTAFFQRYDDGGTNEDTAMIGGTHAETAMGIRVSGHATYTVSGWIDELIKTVDRMIAACTNMCPAIWPQFISGVSSGDMDTNTDVLRLYNYMIGKGIAVGGPDLQLGNGSLTGGVYNIWNQKNHPVVMGIQQQTMNDSENLFQQAEYGKTNFDMDLVFCTNNNSTNPNRFSSTAVSGNNRYTLVVANNPGYLTGFDAPEGLPQQPPAGEVGLFGLASAVNTSETATSVTLTPPATPQDGNDLMIVFAMHHIEDTAGTINWPSGFSQAGFVSNNGHLLGVAYKTASSESGGYTVSVSGANGRIAAGLYIWTGSDGEDVTGTQGTGTGTAATVNGVTTTGDKALHLIITAAKQDNAPEVGGMPTGYTFFDKVDGTTGGFGISFSIGFKEISPAGATGNVDMTLVSSTGWHTFGTAVAASSAFQGAIAQTAPLPTQAVAATSTSPGTIVQTAPSATQAAAGAIAGAGGIMFGPAAQVATLATQAVSGKVTLWDSAAAGAETWSEAAAADDTWTDTTKHEDAWG